MKELMSPPVPFSYMMCEVCGKKIKRGFEMKEIKERAFIMTYRCYRCANTK